jgi:hypothetical protein
VSTPSMDETAPESTENPEPPGSGAPRAQFGLRDAARWLAALAMLGAGVIHFAYAPHHLEEQTSHGVFFLVVGWAQLAGAAALAFSWRPQRAWLQGTALLNLGVAAIWLVSRTAGLPGEQPEAVGFPDSLASALEVVAAVAALAIAYGWLVDRPLRATTPAMVGVPVVAVVALVSASFVPALGGGHSDDHGHQGSADGGHDDSHAALPGETAAGHDHGGDPSGDGGADFAQQRLGALSGYLSDSEIETFKEVNRQYLADYLRRSSRVLRGLPEAEREARITEFVTWSVDNALSDEGEPHGDSGEPSMHMHGIVPWQPLTEPADQLALQSELKLAATVMPTVMTAADALAKGYIQVTPYVPGIGAHYLNIGLLDGTFDPARPEMLLYNGNKPTSELVGLSYGVLADQPPEGFTGPNDQWHEHPELCILGGLVVGPDSTPQELCDSIGARKGMGFDKPFFMAHLWQVPGWESSWGLFSGENPTINLVTTDVGK